MLAPVPPGYARRSRLASGPGGLQQNANLFLREPSVWRRGFLICVLVGIFVSLWCYISSKAPGLHLRVPLMQCIISSELVCDGA